MIGLKLAYEGASRADLMGKRVQVGNTEWSHPWLRRILTRQDAAGKVSRRDDNSQ